MARRSGAYAGDNAAGVRVIRSVLGSAGSNTLFANTTVASVDAAATDSARTPLGEAEDNGRRGRILPAHPGERVDGAS